MAKLRLEIITPERILFQKDVDEVQVPIMDGEIGILPGHTPLISQLALAGLLKYRNDGTQSRAVVGKGFVEVNSDKVTVLASLAELPNEINLESARHELESAERTIKAAEKNPDIDIEEALVKLERSMIRVQAAEKSAE